jgi:O-antigen/teichoic acid export membrane protein
MRPAGGARTPGGSRSRENEVRPGLDRSGQVALNDSHGMKHVNGVTSAGEHARVEGVLDGTRTASLRGRGWLPRDYVQNAFVLLGGRFGFHALNLLTGVLLARGLQPDGRGAYVAVMVWPYLLGWWATLGIGRATVYLRAKSHEHERDLVAIGLWVTVVVGSACALVAQGVMPWLLQGYPEEVVGLGRLTLLLVPVVAASAVLLGVFDGAREYWWLTTFRLSLPIVQVVGLTALFFAGRLTVTTAVWLYFVGTVVTVGLQYLVIVRRSGAALWPRQGLAGEAWRYALRFYPVLVADVAVSFLDQVLLVPILSPAQMGLYAIATRAAIIVDVPTAMAQLVFAYVPRMSPLHGIGLVQRSALAGVLVTGALSGGLFVVARPLLSLLYGEAFLGAVAPFRILLLGAFAVGVRQILAEGLSGLGRPQYNSAGQVISLIAMAALLCAMVPAGGIVGAAWAVAIAQWTNLAVTVGLFWLERRRGASDGRVSE